MLNLQQSLLLLVTTIMLSALYVKFLGIVIENSCTWKAHIAQLLPEFYKACFLIRVTKLIMSTETLKIVYYSYFHSLMTCGIIFWGNSSFSMQIFRTQNRMIRVMNGLRPRDSCREAFRDWGILPLQCQYIFFLLIFVVNNMGFYHLTSQIHGFNTGRNFDLYRPQTNLSICQRENRILSVLNSLIIFL
jgi:hypothetical protein